MINQSLTENNRCRSGVSKSLFASVFVAACVYIAPTAFAENGQRTLAFDPSGDTFGNSTLIDIDRFSAEVDDGALEVTVSFFGPITPADEAQPNSVSGLIDIDIDQDAETGNSSIVDDLCPGDHDLGVEYVIDMDTVDDNATLVDLFDGNGSFVEQVSVEFKDKSFSVSIPLPLFDGDDGIANLAAVMGNDSIASDCVPNSGFITSTEGGTVLNVSTNAFVNNQEGFVVGFIVTDGSVKVALTGESAPSLGPPLADAVIDLVNVLTFEVLDTNDDCSDDPVAQLEVERIIGRSLGAETDACLVKTLNEGNYGLRVRDKDNGAGFGLGSVTGAVED